MGDIGIKTDEGELERVVPEEAPVHEPSPEPAREPATPAREPVPA